MLKTKWTHAALNDLQEAIEYIGEENPAAAKKVALRVSKAIKLLREMPTLGRKGRYENLREWVVSETAYIIWYRVREDDGVIEVVRVFHHSRKVG